MKSIHVRISEQEAKNLENIKTNLNLKTTSEAVRKLISMTQEQDQYEIIIQSLSDISRKIDLLIQEQQLDKIRVYGSFYGGIQHEDLQDNPAQ
jgi:hypothetical protein